MAHLGPGHPLDDQRSCSLILAWLSTAYLQIAARFDPLAKSKQGTLTVLLSTLQAPAPLRVNTEVLAMTHKALHHPPDLSSVPLPLAHSAPGAMASSLLQPVRPSPASGLLHVLWFLPRGILNLFNNRH